MTIDDREKSSGLIVRRLIRTSCSAALATVDGESSGTPYASMVLTACTLDGSPLMLLSDLARHSRNLGADARASILFGKLGSEALNQTRATVIGRIEQADDELARARFLRRHANARDQMMFADFRLYRMHVESVHFIAGFGRIETLPADDVVLNGPDHSALAAAEQDIVDHMNSDHGDAVHAYAHILADRHGKDWEMIGIDPEGIDLMRFDADARVDFTQPVEDPQSARAELVRLAKAARNQAHN
ncbi:MAG: heme iron utilization protein [Alphaproteobacteria bacterium]|nr:heme iron utilization protein [Alphaproteobacteria bacterium]